MPKPPAAPPSSDASDPPGRGPRGRKPSPELREAILRAALSLFGERGAASVSTREIAAAAGTTERTLFKHFGSKDGLIQAVGEKVSFDLMQRSAFARIADPAPLTREAFFAWHRDFLADRITAARALPDAYRVLFQELFRDPAFRERYARRWTGEVFTPLAGHLARLQEAGAITSRQSPQALAGGFFSLNLGYLLGRFALGPDGPWDDARDAETTAALFEAMCG
jgi:AcrR family transcriptional regulator